MLKTKNVITILFIIVVTGAFLRFYKLGETSFVADEFLDINSSYAYFKTGIWQKWDFNFGQVDRENVFAPRDERAWIYKWQVAQLFKFMPPTEATARAVSALWGIVSIILIYFAATYFSKKKGIGLLSAFLFAVSISGIIFDRRLRMYSMFFAVFLVFSWMLFRFLEEPYTGQNKFLKKLWDKLGFNFLYLLPMFILGIISLLTHQLTANIIFIYIIYAVIQMGINFQKNKYFYSLGILIAGIVFSLIFFPKIISEYTAGLKLFNDHWNYFGKAFSDYSQVTLGIIFLALGIYWLYSEANLKKESLWLAVSFIGTIFLAVFVWNRNVGDQYIFFIKSFGIILVAGGIYFAAKFFEENLGRLGKKAFYVSLFLSLLILPNWAYFFQENNTYKQTSESENPNYQKVFANFKKDRINNDVLVTRNVRNYYWSGAKVKVYDFGVDMIEVGTKLETKKLTLDQLQNIISENPSGWLIVSDNDEAYLSNGVMDWVAKNLNRVSNPQVRGKISVYRWGN